jgi:hypothetical protein
MDGVQLITKYHKPGGNMVPPRPIRLTLDEAGSTKPVPFPVVQNVATLGRSQNMTEDMFYQNRSQVTKQYPNPKGSDTILLGNMPLKRCIATSEEESARY